MKPSFATIFAISALAIAGLAAEIQPAAAYQCKHLSVQAGNSVVHHKANLKAWAQETAISGWSRKVKANFGLAWSVWSIAKNTSVSCSKVGSNWSCKAKGKPCKYVVN